MLQREGRHARKSAHNKGRTRRSVTGEQPTLTHGLERNRLYHVFPPENHALLTKFTAAKHKLAASVESFRYRKLPGGSGQGGGRKMVPQPLRKLHGFLDSPMSTTRGPILPQHDGKETEDPCAWGTGATTRLCNPLPAEAQFPIF